MKKKQETCNNEINVMLDSSEYILSLKRIKIKKFTLRLRALCLCNISGSDLKTSKTSFSLWLTFSR